MILSDEMLGRGGVPLCPGPIAMPEGLGRPESLEDERLEMKCLSYLWSSSPRLTSNHEGCGRGYKELFEKMAANIGFVQREYEKV
ncbi:MAG: hypothetical protein EHM14_15660 [Methanothrix sp.]|nr:MAG: hypothetical protein EHM14_15660 [Methanothrix sp.]